MCFAAQAARDRRWRATTKLDPHPWETIVFAPASIAPTQRLNTSSHLYIFRTKTPILLLTTFWLQTKLLPHFINLLGALMFPRELANAFA